MVIFRAYKFRIYPNNKQKQLINKSFGCFRFIYNYYLSKKRDYYKLNKNNLSLKDIKHDLVFLRIIYILKKGIGKFKNKFSRLRVATIQVYKHANEFYYKTSDRKKKT